MLLEVTEDALGVEVFVILVYTDLLESCLFSQ